MLFLNWQCLKDISGELIQKRAPNRPSLAKYLTKSSPLPIAFSLIVAHTLIYGVNSHACLALTCRPMTSAHTRAYKYTFPSFNGLN